MLVAGLLLARGPDRTPLPPRTVAIRSEPVALDPPGGGLRIAGAWRLTADDPRFGGLSALAIDGDDFLALSDSGVVIRFARPGAPAPTATLSDLPAGPGSPRWKKYRDSEALARDPAGRGWWVAFENRHELWLYDPDFTRPLRRIALGRDRWPVNSGIEAMIALRSGLLLVPEAGERVERVDSRGQRDAAIGDPDGRISDAARLPDGRLLLIARRLTLGGFRNALVELRYDRGRIALGVPTLLGLGALDNGEGITAERLPDGRTRLWVVTDDNFNRGMQTLLVAIDLARER